MVKRFRKPDTVEAYNAAGFRERDTQWKMEIKVQCI